MSKAGELLRDLNKVEEQKFTPVDDKGYVSIRVELKDGRAAFPVMISNKFVSDRAKKQIRDIVLQDMKDKIK